MVDRTTTPIRNLVLMQQAAAHRQDALEGYMDLHMGGDPMTAMRARSIYREVERRPDRIDLVRRHLERRA